MSLPDFASFFGALWGYDPFPWQTDLAERVLKQGWPKLLDLPTGTGKTASLDIAVWALAHRPEVMPRRIFMVIDRRSVVDQAHERAQSIAKALRDAETGCLATFAARLRELGGESEFGGENVPLLAVVLRGAIPRNDTWLANPAQPLLAVSTVDQVGSRLLFRGYGVRRGMRPVHAGLLANDALFLLDEVHLSEPFAETLRAIEQRYRGPRDSPLPDRWSVTELSATPRAGVKKFDAFELGPLDHAHPILQQRLRAAKPVEVGPTVKVSGGEPQRLDEFGRQCAERLHDLGKEGFGRLALIVNRVDSARAAHRQLQQVVGTDADVVLVTGRMRPIDREKLEGRLRRDVGSRHRPPEQLAKPLMVVSTQCLEAGADLDFDAMVCECASLDALRQRFGRLNRMGHRKDARGVVMVRADQLRASDPIYGEALGHTWRFLESMKTGLDFGISRFSSPKGDALKDLISPANQAPKLLPAYLDAWVQTSQALDAEPEVSLWLHGTEHSSADVQIVWRGDLTPEWFVEDRREQLLELVEALPPSPLEAVTISRRAAVDWLMGLAPVSMSDVVFGHEIGAAIAEDGRQLRPALIWRGAESRLVTRPGDVVAGDTLVVPASYGGLFDSNWAPENEEPVLDVAEQAAWRHRGRAVLRLLPALFTSQDGDELEQGPALLEEDEDQSDLERVKAWLAEADSRPTLKSWLEGREEIKAYIEKLAPNDVHVMRVGPEPGWYVIAAKHPRKRDKTGRPFVAESSTEDDDSASMIGRAVSLQSHLLGVGKIAREFAERVGLGPELARDFELAGKLHDLGKADPRFQKMLLGGSEFFFRVQRGLLAKSDMSIDDRRQRRLAAERSGYPQGMRHELLSLAMVANVQVLRSLARDWDLVLHLVASHHGWCRPFAPVCRDPEPRTVTVPSGELEQVLPTGLALSADSAHQLARIDSGVADRFWLLVRRYGWFGLTWLEAIFRLADHRRSAIEQEEQ